MRKSFDRNAGEEDPGQFLGRRLRMSGPAAKTNWGTPPWTIHFSSKKRPLPKEVDFAIVGGGVSGLSAAALLRRFGPSKNVALFRSTSVRGGSRDPPCGN